MPDNLTISIGADTSKLRADIKLATAELQNLGRQVNQAVKTGDTARARELSDTFGRMQSNLAGLNRELKATTGAMDSVGRSTALTTRSFRSLEGAALGLGKSVGGLQAGFAAFGAAIAGRAIAGAIGDVVDNLNKLNQTASNTNISAADIKVFQDFMVKAGLSTEDATAALTKFAGLAQDAKLKAGALGNTFGVQVRRGTDEATNGFVSMTGAANNFVQVFRGGAQPLTDLSEPLSKLGIQARDFGTNMKGVVLAAQMLQARLRANREEASALGQAVFGADWEKITRQLVAYANTPAWAEAKAQADALTGPEAQAKLAVFNAAWGQLKITLNDALMDAVITWFPEINAALKELVPTTKAVADAFKAEFSEINAFIQTTKQEVQGLIDLYNSLVGVIRAAGAAVTSGAAALSAALPGTGDAGTAAPFASGGYVRGPGSGTSDSILARLSNGEFVMRASAVNRWGAQFMSAINGFADGGMVMPSRGIPSFAAGGLVSATTSDGTPVTLVFPGGSFALRGDNSTVGALTREARRAGMLTGGRRAGMLQ